MKTEKRCPQCWRVKACPSSFIGAKGKPIGFCMTCRARYRGWMRKTLAQKLATPRRGVPSLPGLRAKLYPVSGNKKLGGIPASVTSRNTCPPTCGLFGAGCYAEYGKLAFHWRRVGERGDDWTTFLEDVAALPEGTLWRHNEAGELPGDGEEIDAAALGELVEANRGKLGFTFTHKHRADQLDLLQAANLEACLSGSLPF